jgi:hypothetical protein
LIRSRHFLGGDSTFDLFLGLFVLVGICLAIYQHGKKVGSRKGFGVGLNRGYRHRRR